jgi:YggT family protein
MDPFILIIARLIQLLAFAIFARAILSWFPIDRNGPIFRALDAVTEPVLGPLRRVIPLVGMIDITPMIALFLLFAISAALQSSVSG